MDFGFHENRYYHVNLYQKSGSLWVCILIHGLTNLAIALMVRYAGMVWLW